MTAPSSRTRSDRRARGTLGLRDSGVLAVCIVAMNVSTFGFQLVGARLLGPAQYGGVSRMMALLLILGVVQLALQATAARRVSAAPEHPRSIERVLMALSVRAGLALGLLALVLSPLVERVLRLDSLVPAVLVAATAVPMTVMGGQAGVLQGERRWRELALLYLGNGLPRLLLGVALMLVRPTEGAAMAAVLLGQIVPALVGWWALRSRTEPPARGPLAPAAAETVHGSMALLAFYVLANLDVILAGHVLDRDAAGLYAAGLIVTKVVLFAPQVVVVLAFPSMSSAASGPVQGPAQDPGQGQGRRWRTPLLISLATVAGVGAVATLGSWLLSGVAMIFVGGEEYAAVQDRLWLFALLGSLLAAVQLLVYSDLARRHHSSTYLVWAAALVVLVVGALQGSVTGLLLCVALVDAVLVTALLALALRRSS